MNQRVPKANFWIIIYCTLEIKTENEPSISLPACQKMKICFTQKTKQNKTKGPKIE